MYYISAVKLFINLLY